MINLEALEQDLADKRLLLSGPAEKAMRGLIEEVRKLLKDGSALAASQCVHTDGTGLVGDEGGNAVCLRAAPSTQPRQWGPWVPWSGGECPIPDAKAGEFGLKFRAENTLYPECVPARIFAGWWHHGITFDIVAYRVRIPADDLLRQAVEALREAREALVSCYNGRDWLAGSTTSQDAAISTINAVLSLAVKRGL